MDRSAQIRARIDPKLKREAEVVLSQIGLTATAAITLFYRQIALQRRLPFSIELPASVSTEPTLVPTAAPAAVAPAAAAIIDPARDAAMEAVLARLDQLTSWRFG